MTNFIFVAKGIILFCGVKLEAPTCKQGAAHSIALDCDYSYLSVRQLFRSTETKFTLTTVDLVIFARVHFREFLIFGLFT